MTKLSKNHQGFTLVELLVALTLLTVGLLAVAAMQTVALNTGGISYKMSTASSLAHEAMDDILSWSTKDTRLTTNTPANTVYQNNLVIQGASTYNITYATQVTIADAKAVAARVDVTVTDVANPLRFFTLTGYKRLI